MHSKKGKNMKQERIQELIEYIWDNVETDEDLDELLAEHGEELDQDFMAAISQMIENAGIAGNEDLYEFLAIIEERICDYMDTRQPNALKTITEDRAFELIDKIYSDIQSEDDVHQFMKDYLFECDRIFFSALKAFIEREIDAGNPDSAKILRYFGRNIINTKTKNIEEMLNRNPNGTFPYALDNLQCAQILEDKDIVVDCAFLAGTTATYIQPSPKVHVAIAAYDLASEIALELEDYLSFASAQYNLGEVHSYLLQDESDECLKSAVQYYNSALEIYTEGDYAQETARTHFALGIAYSDMEGRENIEMAIEHYRRALEIYSREDYPEEYADAKVNLGIVNVQISYAEKENEIEYLKKAHAHMEDALLVFTQEEFPQRYAVVQNNLAEIYRTLSKYESEYLDKAIEAYENALQYFPTEVYPKQYEILKTRIVSLQESKEE